MPSPPTVWGLHHIGGLPLVEGGIVAIGWRDAGDLTGLSEDREAFKNLLRSKYPSKSEAWVANAAGQLLRFRYVMQPGDLVVYPRKADRTINVGQLTGDYVYDAVAQERYPNIRPVEWLQTALPRDGFTQGCLYEFGSALAVFTITTHTGEVMAALGQGSPAQITAPIAGTIGASASSARPTRTNRALAR